VVETETTNRFGEMNKLQLELVVRLPKRSELAENAKWRLTRCLNSLSAQLEIRFLLSQSQRTPAGAGDASESLESLIPVRDLFLFFSSSRVESSRGTAIDNKKEIVVTLITLAAHKIPRIPPIPPCQLCMENSRSTALRQIYLALARAEAKPHE
jgi:hypothetical protein